MKDLLVSAMTLLLGLTEHFRPWLLSILVFGLVLAQVPVFSLLASQPEALAGLFR
jgi:Na+-transporting methylmalonyl-CoA/oxaloacetate decarboxylase beta subunit